jgi:hypothetical protein
MKRLSRYLLTALGTIAFLLALSSTGPGRVFA